MPSGANCKSGVCECDERHTCVRGGCRPLNGLGGNCKTDSDSYFGYDRQLLSYRDKICECAKRHAKVCRHKSMVIDDCCSLDTHSDTFNNNIECQLTSAARDDKSQINNLNGDSIDVRNSVDESQSEIAATKSREIAVQTSIDLYELKPSLRHLRNDRKNHNFIRHASPIRNHSDVNNLEDDDKTLSTLSSADDDEENERRYERAYSSHRKSIKSHPHSICAENHCICRREGYFRQLEKCFAEIGEIVDSTDDCEFLLDELTKPCICQKNYFYDRKFRACKKPAQHYLACTSHFQRNRFGSAVPRRCNCEFSTAPQLCAYKKYPGILCDKNEICMMNHSLCLNHHCVCNERYFEKKGTGLPVDEFLKTETDYSTNKILCGVADSDVDMKTCQCPKGFVHFKDECLKEVADIGKDCIDIEQCVPLLGVCNETNKCLCKQNQNLAVGQSEVQKGCPGEACKKGEQCFLAKQIENVECGNSVCQCKITSQADIQPKPFIRVVPKKTSSGRPSALKIITFMLIGSACIITGAALKQAYY